MARLHARVADARRDHHHKLSTRWIRENQAIHVETLSVRGLARTRLARSLYDAAWGSLLAMLRYKAAWYGRELIAIDRFFPSTRLCSCCGAVGPKRALHVLTQTCDACGVTHNRDANASQNILAAGDKAAMAFEEALHCIQAESGRHFDPLCVDAFEMAWDEIRTVQNSTSSERLAAIVRGIEPWARIPEMRREIVSR